MGKYYQNEEFISISYLSLCSMLKQHNIFEYENESYECLFTCPPYSNKENWNGDADVDKTCDEWIDICIEKFKCKAYLFVVDDTHKYKKFIVDTIENKSHLGTNFEKVILIK